MKTSSSSFVFLFCFLVAQRPATVIHCRSTNLSSIKGVFSENSSASSSSSSSCVVRAVHKPQLFLRHPHHLPQLLNFNWKPSTYRILHHYHCPRRWDELINVFLTSRTSHICVVSVFRNGPSQSTTFHHHLPAIDHNSTVSKINQTDS